MCPLAPVVAELNPKTSLLFGSGDDLLITEGVFCRIETPAVGSESVDAPLQRQIAEAFARAVASGIPDPIVIGALPFDTRSPSCLIVPQRHRRVRLSSKSLRRATPPVDAASLSCQIGREAFESTVRELLALFRAGMLQKVVLSRVLELPLEQEIDSRQLFARLLETSGYRFYVPLGNDETLIGASPELLVHRRGTIVTSNPLAGSIPRSACKDQKTAATLLMSSPKDRHEHRLVVEQMRSVLARHCHVLDVPQTPTVLGTAALWHLSTEISGVLSDAPLNALALACALHPTPAVCGHPCELARETIFRVEPFDRGLFTGTTGWMNARGDGEWAVTIRCCVLGQRAARLYAGAGIVEGSVPELEWAETTAKLSPMLGTLSLAIQEARR